MLRPSLQRAFDTATGGFLAVCPKCLGPSKFGTGVLLLQDDEPVPQCPACQGAVDLEGRSVGTFRDGRLHLKVIRLFDRTSLPMPAAEPSPP